MAATWDEIRQLQADFKQVQQRKQAQKLSERNCVELVLRLIEWQLIDVVHTIDGREYVTSAQLKREIQDEVSVHVGRLSLSDLSATLALDYSIVEKAALELVADKPKALHLVLGQLIGKEYLDRVAEEVDDELQTKGSVDLAQLTTQFDLPLEFLRAAFETRLGVIIQGRVDAFDKNLIYTDAFLSRHRARVSGALRGATRPTAVTTLLESLDIQARIFFGILDDLIEEKKIAGTLIGGHQETATFVPDVYSRTQDQWISSFYRQNGYFDYATMQRLGVTDPKAHIRRSFPDETLLHLSSVCVGPGFLAAFEGVVEDAVAEGKWCDVAAVDVTSVSLGDRDIHKLLTFILQRLKIPADRVQIYEDTILFCQDFRKKLLAEFDPVIAETVKSRAAENAKVFKKAAAAAASSASIGVSATTQAASPADKADDETSSSKDDRRKRAAGGRGSNKGGGGTAREIKTKSVKKKGKKGGGCVDEEEDESRGGRGREVLLDLMSKDAMAEHIESRFPDFPAALAAELVDEMERAVNLKYTEAAKGAFDASSGTGADKRKLHQAVGDRVNALVTEIRLYEKGIICVGKVESEDHKNSNDKDSLYAQLSRHLLKTLGSETANALFNVAAHDVLLKVEDEATMTPESRLKILANVEAEPLKARLKRLHDVVADASSVADFLVQVDPVSEELQILVKKADKKKEKQLLQSQRVALLEKVQQEEDPALLLHLAVCLAFQNVHQAMVHCSGRIIPSVVAFLTPRMDETLRDLISSFQENVVAVLGRKLSEEEEALASNRLTEMKPKLREAVITMKKGGGDGER